MRVRAAIIGATGYAGAELIRLLSSHPHVETTGLYASSKAGQSIEMALPSFTGLRSERLLEFDAAAIAKTSNLAFCALPHGVSASIVAELRQHEVVVIDLSADFRLRDSTIYEEWYGPHKAAELLGTAIYGLVEWNRVSIRQADLIAVPGCYPTASILGLAPLLADGLIDPSGIVIDAKSGVSGAGRRPSSSTHFPECSAGIRAYKAAGHHRHIPEIEQFLSDVAGKQIRVTFTPHLVPMKRGILATSYGMRTEGTTVGQCTEAARSFYEGSPSVAVLEANRHPDTGWVAGSNRAHVAYAVDERTDRIVVQVTIDNLIKGAAGQAVQAMNVRYGFPEGTGISGAGAWP